MREFAQVSLIAILSVFGAHALAYVLIQLLPDPAMLVLGLFSVQTTATEALREGHSLPNILTIWWGYLQGDFGRSIDGIGVISEIFRAIANSAHRLLFVILGMVVTFIGCVRFSGQEISWMMKIADLLNFMPPFIYPLGMIAVIFLMFSSLNEIFWPLFLDVGCIVSMMIAPCCLVFVQTRSTLEKHLSSQYALRMQAYGESERATRRAIMRNVLLELLPSFEKALTGLLTALIFAEYVFGVPGIGMVTIRAVTRADWALVLGLVLMFALIMNVSRIASLSVRRLMQNVG